ncbi:sensory rhodopsin transducer [Streptomyces winkii]|uniref:sensory rhodopsin transducer n=1 Tax=Streptomyces winkii TaxID=3051178 RepID=UPI0028D13BAC|nr:sensory rhodopsin transducer [Streptomyces sp. DSM 40971]
MHAARSPVGSTVWVIADGYIPDRSSGPEPEMTSHDSICILNAGEDEARVDVYVYFTDREPAGPFALRIGARRAFHQRINDFHDPERIPTGTDYCLVVVSDVPIVVQHTRLDSRQEANALMSTVAYPAR